MLLPGLEDVARSPQRIRFSRFEGKKLPPNTRLVTRATRWGNPFPVTSKSVEGHAAAVEAFRAWMRERPRYVADVRRLLVGRSLACSCPTGWPCHGDALLAVAAGEEP